jgi:hypothetical protein
MTENVCTFHTPESVLYIGMFLNRRKRSAKTKVRAPGSNIESADKLYSYSEVRW